MSLRTVTATETVTTVGRRRRPAGRTGGWRRAFRRDWRLYSLAIVPVAFLLLFKYVPMFGNVIAFRRYVPGGSIFGEEWVGFTYFERFLGDAKFWEVFGNTLIIGALSLVIVFPLPIILALLLNEVRVRW